MEEALSDALKEAYATAPTNDILVDTLEFRHNAFDYKGSIKIVRDYNDLEAHLEVQADGNKPLVKFLRFAFDIVLPTTNSSASKEFVITLDGVSGVFSENLEKVNLTANPVEVFYRPYLLSNLKAPEIIPPYKFILRSVSISPYRVEAKASFETDLSNRSFPNIYYTLREFPGLA